jgi:hypothetical protein
MQTDPRQEEKMATPGTMATPGKIIRKCTFESGSAGLLPAFCDYSLASAESNVHSLDFLAEVRRLPKEVEVPGRDRNAFYIQSFNSPDDIFMYLKGVLTKADGIVDDKDYKLAFQIHFASNAVGGPGSGGSPSSVWLKAGGSTVEPVPALQPNNYLSINVDKGDQENGGKNLGFIGSIWNGQEGGETPRYILLKRDYEHPFPIRSSLGAELWFAVGTESGFEALTGIYYYSITVTAERLD